MNRTTAKYRPYSAISLPNRQWPSNSIDCAPLWCSVDLRDGNQALQVPMTVEQKLDLFDVLVTCGFKEIEVGFPAASPTEFEFVRRLIDEDRIPSDVTIQVLTQAREDQIRTTAQAVMGAQKVIIHLYNSTSPAQRRIVFGLDRAEVIALAVQGAAWVQYYTRSIMCSDVRYQYSPESFSATELEFALEICEAVMDVWQPTPDRKVIINLPATVEVATPNVYADQIEWFCRNMSRRHLAVVSVHTHNDRGTGIAATELALLAGADRVEGTLFGNGERTGNADLVTLALNMHTQGVDPEIDIFDVMRLREVYERVTMMSVPPRHPYSGDLVYTAFSGSHQDAISKGLRAWNSDGCAGVWEVPYLTIDPQDVGRTYEEVIRVNGQSGKGGIAYLLESAYGIRLPKDMAREFGSVAGKEIDALKREATPDDLRSMLWHEYVERGTPYNLDTFTFIEDVDSCRCIASVSRNDKSLEVMGVGNGPLDAFVCALRNASVIDVAIECQAEHSLGSGSEACAIAYVKVRFEDGMVRWGAGVDTSIPLAAVKSVVSAMNRR